jgi:hypothetical protein
MRLNTDKPPPSSSPKRGEENKLPRSRADEALLNKNISLAAELPGIKPSEIKM